MRILTNSKNPELRGSLIGLSMLAAAAIVFGGIVAIVLIQETWVVVAAVILEIAVILAGVMWVLPVLSDGEVPDLEARESGQTGDNVVPLERRSTEPAAPAPDKPTDHTPRVAA